MKHAKELNILLDLGLSQQEIDAYLACLRLDGAPASDIAQIMGAKRTTIYATLRSLAGKGLVLLYFKKGKRVYHAVDPQKLPRLYTKKIEVLSSAIPYLQSLTKLQPQPFGVRTIESIEELRLFYTDILHEYKGKSYRAIGSTPSWQGADANFFIEYRKQRAKARIKTRLLLTADSKEYNPQDPSLLREFKYLPEDYPFKSTIDIFDDKILIISPELTSPAVVIETPIMVDVFKSMFDIIWDSIS